MSTALISTYDKESFVAKQVLSKYGGRKTQEVHLNASGLRLLAYNHHNRAGTQSTSPFYRAEALVQLAARGRRALHEGSTDVVILAGDFNMEPDKIEQALLGWEVRHERGSDKTDGLAHQATIAVLSGSSLHVEHIPCDLRWGRGHVSAAHAGISVKIILDE